MACVLLAMFMVAIEATIVATAVPAIVGRLGGFSLYSWVFSAFLMTQAATTLIYGKLADLYGRRPVLIAGILVFLAGSLLCGLSWSMPALILFRLLQGLGAGAIQPVATTLIGDLYQGAERNRVQSQISTVWAVSSVVGPLVGGLIVEHFSWRWVFWLNLPIGVLTVAGLLRYLHESKEHHRQSIDYAGASLFSVCIVALLYLLTQGKAALAQGLVLPIGAVMLLCAASFLRHERRAPAPMIDFKLWTTRFMSTINGSMFLAGMTLIGITTLVPLYIQKVIGQSAIVAGLMLTMVSVGWPLGSSVTRHYTHRVGTRPILRLGGLTMFAGSGVFMLLNPTSPAWLAGVGSFIMGFGMGLMNITCIILVQENFDWSQRASATASIFFSRILGNTVGAALLGGILNMAMDQGANAGLDAARRAKIHALIENPGRPVSAVDLEAFRNVFHHGVHAAFGAVLIIGMLTVFSAFMIPSHGAAISALKGAVKRGGK